MNIWGGGVDQMTILLHKLSLVKLTTSGAKIPKIFDHVVYEWPLTLIDICSSNKLAQVSNRLFSRGEKQTLKWHQLLKWKHQVQITWTPYLADQHGPNLLWLDSAFLHDQIVLDIILSYKFVKSFIWNLQNGRYAPILLEINPLD